MVLLSTVITPTHRIMIDIVIDARMLQSSGIGSYLQGLIPLISAKHNITLLVSDKDHEIYSRYRNVDTVICSSPIYSIWEQVELPLKIPACDIFWSPHYNVPLLPVRAKKCLVTIHDVFQLAFFVTLPPLQKLYAKFILHAAARYSDMIITVSGFSKSEIIKHLNVKETGIRVIYNGINSEDYKMLDNKVLSDTENTLSLTDKYILFVGNIKPNKNIKSLLQAYASLLNQGFTGYDLVIVGKKEGFITGDSEVVRMLEDNAILKEKVFFTGHINTSDLPYIYNSSSLLVLPSLYEGFGLPPLEAMACGCPAIVSNIASLREVCGEAAYYVDPYNAEDIASGICKVLGDEPLRQDLTARGLERVKLFEWKKSAKEHMKVFDEVLGN